MYRQPAPVEMRPSGRRLDERVVIVVDRDTRRRTEGTFTNGCLGNVDHAVDPATLVGGIASSISSVRCSSVNASTPVMSRARTNSCMCSRYSEDVIGGFFSR